MYRKYIGISLIVSLTIIGLFFFIDYYNLSPSSQYEDIEITSTVENYDDEYYKYIVKMEINRKKNDTSNHIVYPIIDGLGGINFINKRGYYSPSAIGTSPKSEETLRREYHVAGGDELIGFSLPKEKGNYKLMFC